LKVSDGAAKSRPLKPVPADGFPPPLNRNAGAHANIHEFHEYSNRDRFQTGTSNGKKE
jgi:hypothetical protein